MPPMAMSSDISARPLGRTSASTGTRLPMRVKSSSPSFTRASWAMARRCSTALVEPDNAMVMVIAFSNALRVRMSRGRMPASSSFTTASPARRQSLRFGSPTASCAELLGSDRPSASTAEAMVFGGVHATAAARTRDGRALDFLQLVVGNLAGGARADGLEHGDDVAAIRAGANGAAVHEYRRADSAARSPWRSRACSCRSRRWRRSRRSLRHRPPSRSSRRSPRATRASSACRACPSRCRPTR